MNKPKQHHYIPKFYLKFFESHDKKDFIWMYQRRKDPIHVKIHNIAKERHFYSIREEDGELNTELETIFAKMEGVNNKILKKLNSARGPIFISPQEKSEISYFLAIQIVRTPAFHKLLKKLIVEMEKIHIKMLFSNEKAIQEKLNEMKNEKLVNSDISPKEMKEFILNDEWTLEIENEKNYILSESVIIADKIYPMIAAKKIIILRSTSDDFITSDYPVSLISPPEIPPLYRGGILMSDILFPISRNTALLLTNQNNESYKDFKKTQTKCGYIEISSEDASNINKTTINNAERFLFGPYSNPEIKKLFDKTKEPKRFHISSPFG